MRSFAPRGPGSLGLKAGASPLVFGQLELEDAARASELILRCFWRFNAEQYGDNTQAFTDQVTPEKLEQFIRSDVVVGAADQRGEFCGLICVTGSNHLELLFVDEAHHRRGVATALWTLALEQVGADRSDRIEITVNSSDHAVGFYETLGFIRVPFDRPIVKRLRFRRGLEHSGGDPKRPPQL